MLVLVLVLGCRQRSGWALLLLPLLVPSLPLLLPLLARKQEQQEQQEEQQEQQEQGGLSSRAGSVSRAAPWPTTRPSPRSCAWDRRRRRHRGRGKGRGRGTHRDERDWGRHREGVMVGGEDERATRTKVSVSVCV